MIFVQATTAKVDLILSLELYKLNLIEEEKNGFSSRKSRSSLTICSPLSISSSCETLLSMDDACVFDDASSVTSSVRKINELIVSAINCKSLINFKINVLFCFHFYRKKMIPTTRLLLATGVAIACLVQHQVQVCPLTRSTFPAMSFPKSKYIQVRDDNEM